MHSWKRVLFLVSSFSLSASLLVTPTGMAQNKRQTSQASSSVVELPKTSSVEEFARNLIAAESDEQRQALVAENQLLITPSLIEALVKLNVINPALSKEPKKVEPLNRLILGLSQQVKSQKGIAVSVCFLGLLHRRNRQLDLALKYFEHSQTGFQAPSEKAWLNRTHRYIGLVHYDQQNYPEAMKHHTREYQLAKEMGENYYIALALYNLGIAYEELEQFKEASPRYDESLKLSQAINTPPPDVKLPELIADTLFRSGRSNFANWKFDQAAIQYQQAAKLYSQQRNTRDSDSALNGLTSSLLNGIGRGAEAHNYDEALKVANENIGKFKGPALGTAQAFAALVLSAQSRHLEALASIAAAKKILEEEQNSVRLRNLYRAEGMVNYAAGNLPQAREAFDRAIKIIEEQRIRIPVNSESGPVSLGYQYSPYGWMVALLASQGDFEEALNYAERSKSRFLYNVLGDPTGKDYRLSAQTNVQERQRLVSQYFNLDLQLAREEYSAPPDNNRIASLKSELQQTREALSAVRNKILSDSAEIANRWPQESKLTRQDLAALLPNEQTALLQFVMSEEQAFLFVATKSGATANLQAYPLRIRKQQIRDGVERFRDLITHQHQGKDIDQVAREWHDKLLGSAKQQLEKIKSLVIVPDGPLWEMPFQALKTADDHYLIEGRAISYAPSFNILRKMSQPIARAVPDLRLLALGNPTLSAKKTVLAPGAFMDASLGPLPEAEKQVTQILKSYGSQGSKVLLRDFATENNFKSFAPKYGILHLAAHGLYNDQDPMRSSIVLSQIKKSPSEDGFLEARELINLRLNAELAILSACETGRGQVRDGEGIIGLPYALFVAGCPTTIVSQWKVSAQSTADLMIALHTNLNQNPKQVSKAEAMRQAALSLINGPKTDFRHPSYWAGFIVFGKAN